MANYLLGIDLGSSSVKVSIIEAGTGRLVGNAFSPANEMEIMSPKPGWAEQEPELWWENTISAVKAAIASSSDLNTADIQAIGISYQMHGLVIVGKDQKVLRPAIIWCDSRAVGIGEQARGQLGELYCMEHLMNSPGNFTLSKLKWVKENEPSVYSKIYKAMLPGDFLAMKLTGEINTTISGLSEGIMWDYKNEAIPERLFNYYGISEDLIADLIPTFSVQGRLSAIAAAEIGLKEGTPLSYRAGDQPNNAFSLNALNPGEVAATAGTSGVVYGVVDKPVSDKLSRVNTFVHVNHAQNEPRYGILLCVNGTGIINSWLRKNFFSSSQYQMSYTEINAKAAEAPVGADGLYVLPFGNGAERILQNREVGASFHGLNLNRHQTAHVCRAVQEGIVYAMGYGFKTMTSLGIKSEVIRAGHANMFLSELFCEAFVNVNDTSLELFNTDGSHGAARGAGIGIGYYKSAKDAFTNLRCIKRYEPEKGKQGIYLEAYHRWKEILHTAMKHIV